MIHGTIFLVAAIAAVDAPAAVQPVNPPPPKLQAILNTVEYRNNVARLLSLLPSDVFTRCAGLVSRPSIVAIIQPLNFSAHGFPISGLWKQSFPVSGCGNDTIINLFFQAQPNDKIGSDIGIPGATHTDLMLQRNTLNYVFSAVKADYPSCSDPHIRTSTYDGPDPSDRKRAWLETWTAAACGHVHKVKLRFVYGGKGTVVTTKEAISITP